MQRKARLEAEGLFDPARKRALPLLGQARAAVRAAADPVAAGALAVPAAALAVAADPASR